MKKILVLIAMLFIATSAFAEDVYVIKGVNLDNFWKKKGIDEEKVLNVGNKILIDNKIPRRVPIFVVSDRKVLNATSNPYDK